jgi:hypothetical protein
MSKKKGKSPAKKTKRKAAPTAAPARRTAVTAMAAAATGRTAQATIVIFRTGQGTKIRTVPQLLYAGPGAIEWTVLNLVDGTNVPVTVTWPNGGPWGNQPIDIRDGMTRCKLDGAKEGRFKYVVSALGATEDPEVEIPEM